MLDAVLSGQSVRALRRGHLSRAMKEMQDEPFGCWRVKGSRSRGAGAEAMGAVSGQCGWSQMEWRS